MAIIAAKPQHSCEVAPGVYLSPLGGSWSGSDEYGAWSQQGHTWRPEVLFAPLGSLATCSTCGAVFRRETSRLGYAPPSWRRLGNRAARRALKKHAASADQ